MTQQVFDAAGFLKFELAEGTIHSAKNEQLALLPPEILESLTPGRTLDTAARNWGLIHGKSLRTHLQDEQEAGVEILADHLGGTLAALGLGKVSVEIRQDALMFTAEHNSAVNDSPGGQALLSGFLSGYLEALVGHPFQVIPLAPKSPKALYWAGNPAAAHKVKQWMTDGESPIQAVSRLYGEV